MQQNPSTWLHDVAGKQAIPSIADWPPRPYLGWIMLNEYMLKNVENDCAIEGKDENFIDYDMLAQYVDPSWNGIAVANLIKDCVYLGILKTIGTRTINPLTEKKLHEVLVNNTQLHLFNH